MKVFLLYIGWTRTTQGYFEFIMIPFTFFLIFLLWIESSFSFEEKKMVYKRKLGFFFYFWIVFFYPLSVKKKKEITFKKFKKSNIIIKKN